MGNRIIVLSGYMFVLQHKFLESLRALLSTVVSLTFLLPLTVLIVPLAPANMAHAVDLSFAWDANTEPDLDGYRLFYREEGQNYDYVNRAWDGSETTCTIYGLDDNTTYYFVARAYNVYGDESEDSVEVCYKRDGIYIERLKPKSCDPGNAVRIIGHGFGNGIVGEGTPAETKSVVHVGPKEFEYDHPRIRLWTNTKIKVRIPKIKYTKNSCGWFMGADFRTQKVWVTVGGLDSNKKSLKILKPEVGCQ